MDEQLPRKFGKYTLLRRIAVGGMAEIYLALHRSISGFEKLLVIKRILPNLTQDAEFLRMFLDEARIAATLNHPNIAQIYDVGSVEDSYFIAMEYVHGEDLRSIVRAMKKAAVSSFPLEHALQIVVGVCSGLDYAHTRTDLQGEALEIVHRDISPQNVLVTFAGDIKVVDFGIARAKMAGVEQNTDKGQLKGKVPYMSPEQCRGKLLDRRSDIFSLGIILFELTSGRRLFRGATEFNTLRMIVEEDYPRPSQFREDYPPDLEQIVMKALEKDPAQRYLSARELQADLEEFVRQHRIAASSLNLSKFLEEIFAGKLALQREALAQGKRLADILSDEENRALETPSGEVTDASMSIPPMSPSGPVSGPTSQPPSTGAWVEEKKPHFARRLAVALVALVLVLGTGGAILFFTSPGSTQSQQTEAFGQIEVRTTPEGAAILLDGAAVDGRTPQVLKKLRLDKTYQIKLTLDGYRHELREVRLTKSHPVDAVTMELRPAGAGILSVNSAPSGAIVFIDGKRTEATTPTTISEVSPMEDHAVLVKLTGYREATDTVSVNPGQLIELNFELEQAPLGLDESLLVVDSEPEGARVIINNEEQQGRTPFEKRMPAGDSVSVEVAQTGFKTYRKSVRLTGGEKVALSASLARDKRVPPREGVTAPTGTGRLYFDATPFCNVSIDGRSYGPTPIVNVELPAGRRRIRCTSPPIGVTKTITVEVPTGGTVRRRVKLSP